MEVEEVTTVIELEDMYESINVEKMENGYLVFLDKGHGFRRDKKAFVATTKEQVTKIIKENLSQIYTEAEIAFHRRNTE